ncbi:hypothetical protein [Owenweeksia hongkongensis]|uniref:hypothetical protein n=1 Tax=Owenweeksia hongkongensis TaxID=253245 RepID=UPI003A8F82C8
MDAQAKLKSFVIENKQDITGGNFIKLFIQKKDDVITLTRELYEYQDIPHQPSTEFEKLLKQQYLNRDEEVKYEGDYMHLSYYWENNQNALIPGFMKRDREIDNHFIEIMAANFEAHWFRSGSFQYPTQFKNRANWKKVHFSWLNFFYDQKKIKPNDWTKLISLITPFDSSTSYGNFIEGIHNIKNHLSTWPDNLSNYENYYQKWEKDFGTTLPFPINRFNIYAEITKAVKKGLEEILDRLSKEKLHIKVGNEVTSTHLKLQQKILTANEPDLSTANEKYLSKLRTSDYSVPITMQSFNQIITKRIAAQFINEHSFQNGKTPANRISSSASRSDLSVLGQVMCLYGMFAEKREAFNFLAENFEVIDQRSKKLIITNGKSIDDSWSNIRGKDNLDKWEEVSATISSALKELKP